MLLTGDAQGGDGAGTADPRRRRHTAVVSGLTYAAIVVLVLIGFMRYTSWDVPLWSDLVRDLLKARQCLTTEGCRLIGPPTSFPYLWNGGLWFFHLAVVDFIGLGLTTSIVLAVAGATLAVLVIVALGELFFSRTAGLFAGGAVLAFLLASDYLGLLQNNAFLPLPAALFLLLFLLALQERSVSLLALALLLFSICAQLHLIALIAAPFVAGLVLRFRPSQKPWLALLIGLGVFLISFSSSSWDALIKSIHQIRYLGGIQASLDRHSLLAFAGFTMAAGVLTLLFLWLRRIGGSAAAVAPAHAAVLVLAVGPMALLAITALVFQIGYRPYYHLQIYLPLAVLAGALVDLGLGALLSRARWTTWGPRVGGVALAVAALFPYRQDLHERLTFRDVEALGKALQSFGIFSTSEAHQRMRSPQMYELLSGLELFLPETAPNSGPTAWPLGSFLNAIISKRSPREEALPGWQVIQMGANKWLYLIPGSSGLDWSRAEVRVAPDDDGLANLPYLPLDFRLSEGMEEPGLPAVAGLARYVNPQLPSPAVEMRVPMKALSSTRLLVIPICGMECEILQVTLEGLQREELPNDTLVAMAGNQAGREGRFILKWRSHRGAFPMVPFIPYVAEVPENEKEILNILRETW